MNTPERQISAFHIIHEQLKEAIEAPKCHRCGCFQHTVEALATTCAGEADIAPLLHRARAVFQPQQYDCLGCPVCYPAIATNAFSKRSQRWVGDLICASPENQRNARAGHRFPVTTMC